MTSKPPAFKLTQTLGDKGTEPTEGDLISAVEYDATGDYIALGDKGGRLTIFNRKTQEPLSPTRYAGKRLAQPFKYYTEFQSHEPEFDYLKSLEIEEKINQIKWCKRSNTAHLLLTTNDKTIKLWKVFDKKVHQVSEYTMNKSQNSSDITSPASIRIPSIASTETVVAACPKKVFSNAHAYHINSIALNSDGETYLSADDLRINLWSLGITNHSFNIIDIKPNNMEELTEVITAADFHPSHCNIMMYSSSRGSIKLGDMRQSALCDAHAKVFEEPENPEAKSFFSEIIASISDIKFSKDGRYIMARDYLTLKIWDLNMESKPVKTIQIHDHLKPRLCDLYENDCIFDKFECSMNASGTSYITGSYNDRFYVYDSNGSTSYCLDASKKQQGRRHSMPNTALALTSGGSQGKLEAEPLNFNKKILHTAWHPHVDEIAVASNDHLYLYSSHRRSL